MTSNALKQFCEISDLVGPLLDDCRQAERSPKAADHLARTELRRDWVGLSTRNTKSVPHVFFIEVEIARSTNAAPAVAVSATRNSDSVFWRINVKDLRDDVFVFGCRSDGAIRAWIEDIIHLRTRSKNIAHSHAHKRCRIRTGDRRGDPSYGRNPRSRRD